MRQIASRRNGVKKILRLMFSQITVIILLLLVQLAAVLAMLFWLQSYSAVISSIMGIFSLLIALVIINHDHSSSYKIVWLLLLAVVPIFGALFYLVAQLQKSNRRFKAKQKLIDEVTTPYLRQDIAVREEIEQDNFYGSIVGYMNNVAQYSAVRRTKTKYLPSGESSWEAMLEQLRRAERYIFLEFFIVEDGEMWQSVYDILKQKAKEGVEVRMMYDAFGCFLTLPFTYYKEVRKNGIQCRVFKQFVPFLTVSQNNRDHRKICVIDGKVAFTGGINLADEYINKIDKYGHWCDSCVQLEGDAAFNFAVMFLQLWELDEREKEEIDYGKYRPLPEEAASFTDDGYVMPYSDTPHDDENVGENVYLDIINKAQNYLYITTPYVILDDEMQTALCFAAKRGVDVRIMVPKNPDHWYAHAVASAFYITLISAGVKIDKYNPGFIHSKTFVADDIVAVVGSINLDFRSLYLHYECAAWMYKSSAVLEVRDDYRRLLTISSPVTIEECMNVSVFRKILNAVLRIFAPLM